MPNEDSKPSPSSPIEILLVDDHPQVRKLLCEMIKTYDDLCIVGEAVNGEEAVLRPNSNRRRWSWMFTSPY